MKTANDPLVSIYCLTYNHENYISDCLDGFVKQKTDFPFEVIVHDDASTDGTQAMIREYEKRYPELIKPIYQSENQFSKDISIVERFIHPAVRGKYVAICEGDDYWTDPEKLQLQVDYLEKHPECHFCVCGVQEVSVNKVPWPVVHPQVEITHSVIEPEEFIQYAATYSFQTSSYVMRYEDWSDYVTNPPDFKLASDIGDLPMLLFFGSLGKTAYIDRVMSCYRRGAPTSYSATKNNWSEKRRIVHFEMQKNVWKQFDCFSGARFHSVCVKKASQNMFGSLLLQGRARAYLTADQREYFHALPTAKKAYILLACVLKKTMKQFYISQMARNERNELDAWKRKQ